MRLPTLIVISLVALTAPAPAETPATPFDPATVEHFLTDTKTLHADNATIGAITVEGDTLTVTDIALAWTNRLPLVDGVEETIVSAQIPSLIIEKPGFSAGRYTFGKIAIPQASLTIAINAQEPAAANHEFSIVDIVVTHASWAPFPTFEDGPESPISRLSPLFLWSLTHSYDNFAIEALELSENVADGGEPIRLGPISFGPVENGRVAAFELEPSARVEEGLLLPDGTPPQNKYETDKVHVEEIDLAPLVHLLAGGGAANAQPFIKSANIDGTAWGGPITLQNMLLDPSRGPIFKRWDEVLALVSTSPAPEESREVELKVLEFGLGVLGSIALDSLQMSDIDVRADTNIGSVSIKGINSEGIERLRFSNISFHPPKKRGFLVFLNSLVVSDARFVTRDHLMKVAEKAPKSIESGLIFSRIGNISLRKFYIDHIYFEKPMFELGNLDYKFTSSPKSKIINIYISYNDLQVPVTIVRMPQLYPVLSAMNADPLKAHGDLTIEKSGDRVTIDERIAVENIGEINKSFGIGGISSMDIFDENAIEKMLSSAIVERANISFQDAGLTPFLLNRAARQTGTDTTHAAENIADQFEAIAASFTGDPNVAAELAAVFRDYLANPKSLSVSAAPSTPVPLAQLIGAAAIAPGQLLSLLNVTATANQ